jgi:hypothetical protein
MAKRKSRKRTGRGYVVATTGLSGRGREILLTKTEYKKASQRWSKQLKKD